LPEKKAAGAGFAMIEKPRVTRKIQDESFEDKTNASMGLFLQAL